MRPSRLIGPIALLVAATAAAHAQAPVTAPYKPQVSEASNDGARAIAKFKVPEGFKVELFAAEPSLANPVAIALDQRNRVFVAETFRLHHGVTDIREHMEWLDEDLASRTTADRLAMYRKHLGESFGTYGVDHDRVRLLEDRDGDGVADRATVFADGFSRHEDGLGAGLLARNGDVWFTCIPDLWRLRDTNGDGVADEREALQKGYGVHVGFSGHDLHGLRFGPDGRLYFSVGDRGLNVNTADGPVVNLESGSVLRCEPDGTQLEVFATGLRNPQELAFDDHGNLFTGDNNSDSGDKARWVHVVEGGDSGWRLGYQFIESPVSRGPWNAEKLWYPRWDGQAAYLIPPIANIADGPSGLTYDPGTGLPARYRNHFFLCDFRGGTSGTSGIRSFAMEPKGASFELVDSHEFLWSILPTDADFGTDGALYVSDWTEGWRLPGKGRIYKVYAPEFARVKTVLEVKRLLAEGMADRPAAELAKLLAHPDHRVRQEAQFTLAAKGKASIAALSGVAKADSSPLARLHAIWGLGQIARRTPEGLAPLLPLLSDAEGEVRAPRRGPEAPEVIRLLRDESPRVRMFAAIGLGKIGAHDTVEPLLRMLRDDGQDPTLRHAAVLGLVGAPDVGNLVKATADASPRARMGVLLALRRLKRPEIARFLDDHEPTIVLEAARAIHDAPVEAAMPRLAAMLDQPRAHPEALLRRAIAANLRLGGPNSAERLATFAAQAEAPEAMRAEALDALASWPKPASRDRIVGLWRPIAPHPVEEAAAPLRKTLPALLANAPDRVRQAGAKAAAALVIPEAGPALASLVEDDGRSGDARVEAIKAIEALGDPGLAMAVQVAVAAKDARVRVEGHRLLAKLEPVEAVRVLALVLDEGTRPERQGALAILGGLNGPAADAILARWLDKLLTNQVQADMQLDLLEAAAKRSAPEVKDKLARVEANRPKDELLARYRETLEGGDAERGRRVFANKAVVECIRCHKIRHPTGVDDGGDVGPNLNAIGREPREHLLESIIAPNRKIAKGFETVVVALSDGRVVAGVVKGDDGKHLRLQTPKGDFVEITADEVEDRKTGASGMPEDLMKYLTRAELRDLIEFLSSMKGKETPAGRPL